MKAGNHFTSHNAAHLTSIATQHFVQNSSLSWQAVFISFELIEIGLTFLVMTMTMVVMVGMAMMMTTSTMMM